MEAILQHFRKDEQPFIETAMDWIREVEHMYIPKLTDFLNPREVYIVQSLIGSGDVLFAKKGVFEDAERKRVLIYPNYYEPKDEDFGVTIFKVKYPTKFLTLKHKDVLGSLMSLGIDRSKFGDIKMLEDEVQFAVASELDDYMVANFTSIGKAKVMVEKVVDKEDFISSSEKWIEETQIVSSMRLDAIVASLVNFSRQKATMLIRSDKVRVNWTSENNPAAELFEEDILSIRGFGRFKMIAIEGRTRKDKVRLITGKLE